MAFDLPLMTPLPLLLGNENGVSAGGGDGIDSLFTLSASVGLTSADFDKGIARLQAAIEALNGNVSGMLSTLNTTVSGMSSNITNVGTDVDTASGKMSDGLGEIEKSADKASTSFDKIWTSAKNVLSVIGNVGKSLISFSLDVGGQLIAAGTSYQQRERTYETAFEGIEKEAGKSMARLSQTTGYYEGVLKGNFAKIQTQFRSSGIAQAEALKLSEETMLLAADAAAHYGISMDDATYKVMSFIRGNQEAGESIGLFITQAKRDEYASKMFDGKTWKALTEDQRQMALLKIAQDTYATGGQEGASAKYSKSFVVQIQNVKQIWADILGKLGTPILEALSPVVSEFANTLSTPEMQESIKSLSKSIADFIKTLADAFVELLNSIRDDPTIVTDFFTMLTDLFKALTELAKVAMPIVQFIISVIGGPDLEYETVDESAWADDKKLRAALKIMQVADKIGDYSKEHPGSILSDDITAFTEAQQAFLKAGGTPEELKTLIDYINTFGVAGYMVGYSGAPGSTGYFNYKQGVGYTKSGQRGSEWAGTDPGEIPAGFYNFMMEEFGIPGERFDTLKQDLEGALSSSVGALGSAFTGALASLPGAMAAGLNGVTVQMDGVVVGHLVAPTVMGDMARNVNFRRNTTQST